ncbi:MAG: UDP-N-acetylmuramate dehydrogenase [Clostridia bacterium]|nr:UDP-N-acetylmuramate dehydrogenase [Clostridia bacterium]
MDKIYKFLDKNHFEYFVDYDISNISAIKIGSIAKLVIFPKTTIELEKLLMFFGAIKVRFDVFGNLSNVLFMSGISYPIIVTNKMNEEIYIENSRVRVSAGMMLPKFAEIMRRNNLSGVEGLIGIPATIGGAIKNNAGAFGFSISDKLLSVKVYFKGKIFNLKKNEIKFSYHYSNLNTFVILEASFLFEIKNEYDIIDLSNKFTYLRGKTQPMGLSLGSVFKKVNGKSAGFFIERSGMKGFREGGIMVSNKHANFFVNDKSGSASDFLHLLRIVQARVEKQFGVWLVPEIEKVGDFNETFSRPSYTFKI